MRLPRFLSAGLLLALSVWLLTDLFADDAAGPVAFSVFTPLWLALSVINAGIGVYSAGGKPGEEAMILLPVFGTPTLAAGLVWWFRPAGLSLGGARFLWFVIAGVALWAAIALLAALLIPRATSETALRAAVAIVVPLWLALQAVNLLVDVLVADHAVGNQVAVSLLSVAVPAGVALAASQLAQRG